MSTQSYWRSLNVLEVLRKVVNRTRCTVLFYAVVLRTRLSLGDRNHLHAQLRIESEVYNELMSRNRNHRSIHVTSYTYQNFCRLAMDGVY